MYIHFVGIGGIGMSGLAEIMLELGHKVSGSDIRETEITQKLRQKGACIYIGHRGKQIEGKDLVVFSSAIRSCNPEIKEAAKREIPLISRGELIARITNLKESIVIAGTHGKTTTTALVAELLLNAKKDPTIFIGGILRRINSNTRLGKSKLVIVESDESDASFLLLRPSIAVITNVENDHLDFYHSPENILQAFVKFGDKIKREGVGIVNFDDPALFYAFKKRKKVKKFLTYGLTSKADIWAKDISLGALSSSFKVGYKKRLLGKVKVPLPGLYNVSNCLAMVGVGIVLGIKWEEIRKTFFFFQGVKRRLDKIGQIGKVPVFDDYAHHPTEIKAILRELKRLNKRIIAIFQPHRYTRTKFLLPDFLSAFNEADVLVLTPIYSAGELPIPGVNGRAFFEILRKERKLPTYYFSSRKKIIEFIRDHLQDNDLIVTIGAGDITRLSRQFIISLKGKQG